VENLSRGGRRSRIVLTFVAIVLAQSAWAGPASRPSRAASLIQWLSSRLAVIHSRIHVPIGAPVEETQTASAAGTQTRRTTP